jgi:hypothetical protein
MFFSLRFRVQDSWAGLVLGCLTFAAALVDSAVYAQCEFRTLSQTEWGDRANTALLTSIMRSAKVVRIGSNRKYAFNSATAVRNFLPTSGTPKALDRTTTNPARNKNNSLAGNLLALKLNILRDPALGDAIVDATLPTFDHDDCIDTPHVLCFPLLASFLGNRNGQITVNQVVALADTVTGAARPPLNMEFTRLFQTISAINESWGRGSSAECNIIKPCGGCPVQLRIFVNNTDSVDPNAEFEWRVINDLGVTLAQGLVRGSDFQGVGWVLPSAETIFIDSPVTFIVYQTENNATKYCQYLVTGVVAGNDIYFVSGFYDDCDGSPDECFPRFDCAGELSTCEQG